VEEEGKMDSFEAGTLAGAGSFRCESCDLTLVLHERDTIPACPSCGGDSFRRASMFSESGTQPAPLTDLEPPDWLAEARDALVADGDYLAFEHEGRVRVVQLQEGWTRIGRSLSAHLRLDDPTVSRRHALVYRDEESAKVLDDRSLNGVFRNGETVELCDLADGDVVSVGRFALHFISLAGDRGRSATAAGQL
jgi:predicted RNA-binding Zn-ribbon protein involved in translation (DUF1610 family)